MSYLAEVRAQIANADLHKLLQLWEEYCSGEVGDGQELIEILEAVQGSDIEEGFGGYVELALPLWRELQDPVIAYRVLCLILDLQTSNSPALADTAYNVLEKRYSGQELFKAKIRLIGLRDRKNFRGALSRYDLLSHLDKGKFVFHTGGWGTGEVLDYSLVREEISLEFENVVGIKYLSFKNAFKYLTPIANDHFLAQRFGNPDLLEATAKKSPVEAVRLLLKDLGPKTAAEIKDEMCELVIPVEEWTKWWQGARTKLKRDTSIEVPPNVKSPFRLRDSELSHAERLKNTIETKKKPKEIIQTIYSFSRDFSEILRDPDSKLWLQGVLKDLQSQDLDLSDQLQLAFLQETLFPGEEGQLSAKGLLKDVEELSDVIHAIDIVAFKKRALVAIQESHKNWAEKFVTLFFDLPQTTLKDYVVKQLNTTEHESLLRELIHQLLNNPARHPQTFIWFFQKLIDGEKLPYSDQEGRCQFFEALLILFSILEKETQYRDLTKKIYTILTRNRFLVVRDILEISSLEYCEEFLLLVSKCQTLTSHDLKILRSLAEVVHPSLSSGKKDDENEKNMPIWTTEEGFEKVKGQLHQLATVDTVENAKEIEAARALGDLRENSEFKFALEKRDRIQSQIKLYTEQLSQARIISPEDIETDTIGVGVQAEFADDKGETVTYTLLGPWDADADKHVLSFQSKLAKELSGLHVGDTCEIQGQSYEVKAIHSIFEMKNR